MRFDRKNIDRKSKYLLEQETVGPGHMVKFFSVFVEQGPFLRGGGELEHLLHHVDGEDVAAVHAHDGLGDLLVGPAVISRDFKLFSPKYRFRRAHF